MKTVLLISNNKRRAVVYQDDRLTVKYSVAQWHHNEHMGWCSIGIWSCKTLSAVKEELILAGLLR